MDIFGLGFVEQLLLLEFLDLVTYFLLVKLYIEQSLFAGKTQLPNTMKKAHPGLLELSVWLILPHSSSFIISIL
jgi:hypothetical protein